MAVKCYEGTTETPDSSVGIALNSSSLHGICPLILALPGGLVITTATRWLFVNLLQPEIRHLFYTFMFLPNKS